MTVTPDFFYGTITNALSHQEEADRIPTAEACVVFLGQLATGSTAAAVEKWENHFSALSGLYADGVALLQAARGRRAWVRRAACHWRRTVGPAATVAMAILGRLDRLRAAGAAARATAVLRRSHPGLMVASSCLSRR